MTVILNLILFYMKLKKKKKLSRYGPGVARKIKKKNCIKLKLESALMFVMFVIRHTVTRVNCI